MRLTALGEQLRHALSAGYRQIMEAIHNATAIAGGISGPLTLGTLGPQPWAISDTIESFQTRHPAARMRYREIQPTAPLDLLRSGEVDIGLVWLPVREPDLTLGRVLAMLEVWTSPTGTAQAHRHTAAG